MALLLVITVGCLGLASCSEEEKNEAAPVELIGVWVYSAPADLEYGTLTFDADGTGELYMRYGYNGYYVDDTLAFSWVGKGRFYDGWHLIINAPDAPDGPLRETLVYDISGNRMTVYDAEDSDPIVLTRK